MDNPHIRKANEALEALSRDPKAQALARWREDQLRLHRVEMAAIERRGVEKGIEQGIEQGIEKERRATVRVLCEALGIEWTPERQSIVAEAKASDLEVLKRHLATHRAWPEGDGD